MQKKRPGAPHALGGRVVSKPFVNLFSKKTPVLVTFFKLGFVFYTCQTRPRCRLTVHCTAGGDGSELKNSCQKLWAE